MSDACKIYFAPVDVHQRLDGLGLKKEIIDSAVRAGLLARRETTTDHPVTAAGFNAWSETVTSLRQQLRPLGWEVDNEANQGLIVNPETAMSIAVVQGDRNTARADAVSSTRSPRGPRTSAAVQSNSMFLFPEMEEDQIAALSDSHRDFWLLMVHVNERSQRVQCELSRPTRMSEGQRPISWSERILFSDFHFGDMQPTPKAGDGTPPQRTPEIVVEVKRRA